MLNKEEQIQQYMNWVIDQPEFQKRVSDACFHLLAYGYVKHDPPFDLECVLRHSGSTVHSLF